MGSLVESRKSKRGCFVREDPGSIRKTNGIECSRSFSPERLHRSPLVREATFHVVRENQADAGALHIRLAP